jgi:anti-sigma regulatory factor (Ser/Thr protein kinase)
MRTRRRATPPGRLNHYGLLYRRREDLVDRLAAFIMAGLDAGEPVLAALPTENLAALGRQLPRDHPDLELADMSVAGRNPGRILPWMLHAFAREAQGRRVRIIGEPIWQARSANEYAACVQHEALINVALAELNVTALCPYDVSTLSSQALQDAEFTHPAMEDEDGGWRSGHSYPQAYHAHTLFGTQLAEPPRAAERLWFGDLDLRIVREHIRAVGVRAGMRDHDLAMLQLAVTEAATNAVEHGGGSGVLRTWIDGEHLVSDVLSPAPLQRLLAGRTMVEHTSVRGRGLLMINQLCDLVRLHVGPSGTAVRMWLPLRRVSGRLLVDPFPDPAGALPHG